MHPLIQSISDPLIRAGAVAGIDKTLLPAMAHPAYPGHFSVTADGSHFGSENTWPGLDSWEMAGAYLLLGHRRLVLDYFAFVCAAQRADGNIPFAILPADAPPEGMDTYLRGLRYPQDVYSYGGRRWIGLFHHWQMRVNPLSVLGAISFILTAGDIVADDPSSDWIADNLDSVESAGKYVLSRKSENGLIAGAGFYIECPPRDQWDGVTQCYAVEALRFLSRLCLSAGQDTRSASWHDTSEHLAETFRNTFWRGDHFAEYVHPPRGVIDLRPLTDVNFAAIGLNVATDAQAKILWPRLTAEHSFWFGGMPTQLVSHPRRYEPWEFPEPLPFALANGPLYDVAAMGRVWFLDSLACRRMNDWPRLIESVRKVCRMGERHNWQWHERYHAGSADQITPTGPKGYCEYAAVLVRIVLSNRERFTMTQ